MRFATRFFAVSLGLHFFFIPLAFYLLVMFRVPTISAEEARTVLQRPGTLLVLLDLPRSAVVPASAETSSAERLLKVQTPEDLPLELQGRKLLLLCPAGVDSARVAGHLRNIGVRDVVSVEGGMQEWIASSADAKDPGKALAFRTSPVHEQFLAVLAFFGIKAVYTVGAVAIIYVLRRRNAADLRCLRMSMIAFFLGEAACAVNVLGFHERSLLLEYLHSFGMVATFAFATASVLAFLDHRIIHCTDGGRCALTGLCRGCIKHADISCGLRRLFLLLIPAGAILAILPLNSSFRGETTNTLIYSSLHTYRHPILAQAYELRVLPLGAMVLLAASFVVLLLRERREFPVSKLLFSAAAGALGFSFLRLLIVASFIDNQVYFALWEELTELLFVGTVAAILTVFRRSLLSTEPSAPAAPLTQETLRTHPEAP
jgi:rhodanese-related sulfurtransferase